MDAVNRPEHYTFSTLEVIDVIEEYKLGYHLGNAVKYIARAGKKNPDKVKEDLDKAKWYLNRYVNQLGKTIPVQYIGIEQMRIAYILDVWQLEPCRAYAVEQILNCQYYAIEARKTVIRFAIDALV